MRIVLCLLALIAAPAWADWVKLGEVDNLTHYIDFTTIRKNGPLRRVWTLDDLDGGTLNGKMSNLLLREYDCKEERHRILSLAAFSEPMAKGKRLFLDEEPSKWSYIPPNSYSASIIKIVCAN